MSVQVSSNILNLSYSHIQDQSFAYTNKKLNESSNIILFPTQYVQPLKTEIEPEKEKQPKSNSLYTSHEIPKPKAQPADSIKTLDEVNSMLQHFLNHNQYRNYALFITGISSAYRISDLLKLKYSDFYNEDGTFKLDFDMIEKKTNNRRKMEITIPIQQAISLYVQKEYKYFEYDSPMFQSNKCKNEAIKEETVHKILKTTGRELNLPYNIGSHTMRKTYGYWYLQIHKNDMTALSSLQEIFGHSSEQITLRYCGIRKEELRANNRDVSVLWENMIGELMES